MSEMLLGLALALTICSDTPKKETEFVFVFSQMPPTRPDEIERDIKFRKFMSHRNSRFTFARGKDGTVEFHVFIEGTVSESHVLAEASVLVRVDGTPEEYKHAQEAVRTSFPDISITYSEPYMYVLGPTFRVEQFKRVIAKMRSSECPGPATFHNR
jgi:hypothetical protein